MPSEILIWRSKSPDGLADLADIFIRKDKFMLYETMLVQEPMRRAASVVGREQIAAVVDV